MTIGDVCEFQRGLTYTKSDEVDSSDNIVLRATNIDLSTNLLSFDELKYISDNLVVPDSKVVKKGSLLVCTASGSKSHLGKVAFIDDDYGYAFGGFMGMLTPLDGLLPKYLFHLMTSEDYRDFIGALSDGANINNLKFDDLKRFPVPVPPLPEQQRIVALLDEVFADLATAKANAERNLRNARALFESHLQSVFSQRGEGWVEAPLADCLELITYGFTNPMPTTAEGPFMITAKNISGGCIDYEAARRTSCAAYNDLLTDKSRPQVGDVLLTKDGTLGRVAVVGRPGICVNQSVAVLRPNGRMHPEFMRSLLSSPKYQRRMADDAGGATIKHIYITRVDKMPVAFPESLQEQSRLSSRLDFLAIETQHLARLYERKLAALEELKKALLRQAFNGEL
jgi:type I restriction enzyme S subunit